MRSNEDLTFIKALKHVLLSPRQVPQIIVSGIEMIARDEEHQMNMEREEEEREEERIQAQVDADLEEESEISAASIPSDFLSIGTPSMNMSTGISSQGLVSSNQSMQQERQDSFRDNDRVL